jgi:hypothetical protein
MISSRAATLLTACVFAIVACSKPAKEGPAAEAPSKKTPAADGKTQAFLQKFAADITARDYAAAYQAVAVERRTSLSQQQFEEAFRHYRDGLPDTLRTSVQVDPYDKDAAVLVPDEFRDRIASEGVIHFEPGDEELEGFSSTVWVVMEAGEPKLAAFYVED